MSKFAVAATTMAVDLASRQHDGQLAKSRIHHPAGLCAQAILLSFSVPAAGCQIVSRC